MVPHVTVIATDMLTIVELLFPTGPEAGLGVIDPDSEAGTISTFQSIVPVPLLVSVN